MFFSLCCLDLGLLLLSSLYTVPISELKPIMMNHRLMIRDALLVLPLLAGLGFWLFDGWFAVGVVLSGLVTVVNMWVIMMLTYRLTASMAGEESNLAVVGVLGLLKVPLVMAVYTVIAHYFGLLSAFLGILVLMAPVCIRGVQFLAQTSVPSEEMEAGST